MIFAIPLRRHLLEPAVGIAVLVPVCFAWHWLLNKKYHSALVLLAGKGSPDVADADTHVGAPAQRDCVPTAVRPNKIDCRC
jgi:hypothetical protein